MLGIKDILTRSQHQYLSKSVPLKVLTSYFDPDSD